MISLNLFHTKRVPFHRFALSKFRESPLIFQTSRRATGFLIRTSSA